MNNIKFFFKTIILIVLALNLGACKDVNLIETPNYQNKNSDFIDVPYINYSDIKKDNSDESLQIVGKYSNNTDDMKIKWNETKIYEETEEIKKLFNKISLNDKQLKLPIDFKKLGEEFSGFEKINLENIDKLLPVNYKNSNSGYELTVLNKVPSIYNSGALKYMGLLFFENKNLFKLELAKIDNKTKVSGIITSIHTPYQSQYSVKVDGIGIGNTLNEMYNKLGKPTIQTCQENGDKVIFYIYNSEKEDVTYFIIFEHSNKNKDKLDIKNNIITSVSVKYSLN